MKKQLKTIAAVTLCSSFLMACASAPQDPEARAAYEAANDPIEPFNRAVFAFNGALDQALLTPAAKAYEFALPEIVRDSVRNFLRHLESPLIFANNILQGDIEEAGKTFGRFTFNTIAGFGGLFDPAAGAGHEYRKEDFGQTLAVWGVSEGPYIMLPFFGPSNLRDTTGIVVEHFADPVNIWANEIDREWVPAVRGAVGAIDGRSRNYKSVAALRETSLDFYSTVRSLYRQDRNAMIENRKSGIPAQSNLDVDLDMDIDSIDDVSLNEGQSQVQSN